MALLSRDEDTICAVSTAPGIAALAVLRVSGPQAPSILRKIAPRIKAIASHRVILSDIVDPETGNVVDESLVTFFGHGRSYTGEASFEISCHGSPIIVAEILRILVKAGARLAEKGEFTYRSFLNGKIDLVQAEGVLDLIESQSDRARSMALRQLKGETSLALSQIEDGMIRIMAHLEASIDFSAEDIELESSQALSKQLASIRRKLSELLQRYSQARLVKEGVRIALIGRPNVGKSSLLNRILGSERVIVSETPGTTRDFVEAEFGFQGLRMVLVDTAGIRDTDDPVELMGIKRSLEIAEQADVVLVIEEAGVDASLGIWNLIPESLKPRSMVLLNKSDTISDPRQEVVRYTEDLRRLGEDLGRVPVFAVSAKVNFGIEDFFRQIYARVDLNPLEDSATLTNERHRELFERALRFADKSCDLLETGESPDLISVEMQMALASVQELLGKRFDDEVMDRVFKEFCLGK